MESDNQLVLSCVLVLTIAVQSVGSERNLALGKAAIQKSTKRHWDGRTYYYASAWRALDGLIHTNDPEEGCTSTADGADTDAWWTMDLGRVYVINNITLYNVEGSYYRLRDFLIRVGNSSDITQHVICAYKPGWICEGASETFTCHRPLSGRWVSIQRTNDYGDNGVRNEGYLQLCEVQVYGYHYKGDIKCDITSDAQTSTSIRPEITDVKAGGGWPVSAVVTSLVLGILLLTVIAVHVMTRVRKWYTRIRKDRPEDNVPVTTGSAAMTGLGHEDDYEAILLAGTQIHGAGNYEQMVTKKI